jgi:hypothetical protein
MTQTQMNCGYISKLTFTTYRKEMKGLDWGELHDTFHGKIFEHSHLYRKSTAGAVVKSKVGFMQSVKSHFK